jgi:mannose-1-phosphate guanylyltransferase/mannose-6-phosphate isomerase
MKNQYAIILCGGSGTRLWPLSRTLKPKQLLALNGEKTLLQQTAMRVCQYIPPENLVTVTHESHRFEVKGQLAEIYPTAVAGVMGEPSARNTLPAIAWGVNKIFKTNPDAIVGVFSSDHSIDNEPAFLAAWKSAEVAAEKGYLTLLGIKPTEPATGYGYIKPSQNLNLGDKDYPVHAVEKFVEKPNREVAEKFVADGYLWNSGMFVFKASVFMGMLKEHQPEIFEKITQLSEEELQAQYATLPNISIDYGLAEKANKVAVVPVDMAWSDLGSWDSIYDRQQKNADKNVIKGEVIAEDTKNSLLWSESGVLTTLGVDNLVVIQTADVTMICDKNRAEDVKTIVNQVKKTYPDMLDTHMTVQRPWGTYTVLEVDDRFKIKRIVVKPGASLSLQMHHHRSEHWVVVSGTAKVVNGDSEMLLAPNQSTYIPAGCKHRLENPGILDLVMVEVQCGQYLGEDDIVRFLDNYGRN